MRRINVLAARAFLAAPLLAISSVDVARAQGQLWTIDVTGEYRTAWIKDLDSDGCDDVVTTCPSWMSSTNAEAGRVLVYSGRTQSLLLEIDGTDLFDHFGKDLAVLGDIDGDSFEDFAISRKDGTRIEVYSAISGSVINSFPYNVSSFSSFANAGDVDRDGASDIVVEDFGQHMDVFSAKTGSNLLHWSGVDAGPVAGTGDLDGDGYPEILLGDPRSSVNGIEDGRIRIYSGSDGSLIDELTGSDGDYGHFGSELVGGSDLNQDGAPDFLVLSSAGLRGYSGIDRTELAFVPLPQPYYYGTSFAGDLDKDGIDEAVVAVYHSGFLPKAHVISCRTWTELYEVGSGVSTGMGRGDANGDGILDVLCGGNHSRSPSDSTTVSAFSGATVPSLSTIVPDRIDYNAAAGLTLHGAALSQGINQRVVVGMETAGNLVVIDDSTVTCTVAPGDPGIYDVTFEDSIGSSTLPQSLIRTPAIALDGDFHPGGHVTVRYLIDPGDGMFAILGLPPPVTIPTPPFHGDLSINPFSSLFFIAPGVWQSNEFDLSGDLPSDPSLVGVQFLFEALVGPSFSSHNKDATWTNLATLTVQ
jgi:IPT/TIG domain-containing protein